MYGFSKEQQMALESELWIADKLSKMGYQVYMPTDFNAECCDLLIARPDNAYKLCVEVKLSRQHMYKGRYPRWQWNVAAIDNKDRVLILIAEDSSGQRWCFVMPGHVMHTRSSFQIISHPSKYGGLISPHLERWETVDFMLGKLPYRDPRQLELFEGMVTE
jgi:hypothetical protein